MQAEWPRKRQQEAVTPGEALCFDFGKRVGGRVNPSQEGLKAGDHTLNHLSPEGWWDFKTQQLGGSVST